MQRRPTRAQTRTQTRSQTSGIARASHGLYSILVLALLLGLTPGLVSAADSAPAGVALVEEMIEAHGGMESWASAPSVTFVEEWLQGAAEEGPKATVRVEQGPRRALIDFLGADMRMAWDGRKAWSVNWSETAPPPRFMALLNYYFLNLPWLTRDPGVILGEPGTARIPGDETEYRTVRMTFEGGVGDTPDDYYVLYIHPQTHRLAANEYIVTYDAILPEGVEHTLPHLLVYDEWTEVDGLVVPTFFTIWEGAEVYARCRIGGWSFSEPFPAERLEMPAGAVVDTSAP